MHIKRCIDALMVAAVIPSLGHAQNAGVALHVGTMGVGADFAVSLNDNVSLRAGANYIPSDLEFQSSGTDFDLSFATPQILTLIDFSPGGAFRISAGAMFATRDFEIAAPIEAPIEVGDSTYQPTDITSLTGTIVTNDIAPYVGIGFGGPARGRVGFFLDLGVAFHGAPAVELVASGPVAADPIFRQELNREIDDVESELDWFIGYPVLSVGIFIGLWR